MKRTVKLNVYEVIRRAVEEGVRCGYNRSFKYSDKPDAELYCQTIEEYVMNALSEVVKFE